MAYGSSPAPRRARAMKKKTPKGSHRMPDGSIMKGTTHATRPGANKKKT